MDRLIPTYHNVVTVAVIEVGVDRDKWTILSDILQFYLVLSLANLAPHDPRLFFPLTR